MALHLQGQGPYFRKDAAVAEEEVTSVSVKVALIQLEVGDTADRADREERVASLVRTAASGGAQFVMLPELWPMGAFNTEHMRSSTSDLAGFINSMSVIARANRVWLHAGSDVEVLPGGTRYNTAAVFNPEGDLVSTYRKLHLWGGAEGEAAVLSAGDAPLQVQTPLGPTGVTTCYELRFPELYRALVDQGAQAYLVVAGWPQARVEHWRTLLRARAIENQAWVLGVNCVGTHAGVTMGGYSAVISPRGEVIAEASADAEEIIYADLDPEAVTQWRAKFGWLADRRTY
ncbi:MAG: carbon-nitrogen family hydrolase [Actinomycetales bacterium]|nr:carbon-nitrogen family hydrolase [Actinomycetales bacterium]